MADLLIFDDTYKELGKSLDVSARRHNLITSNISNMDTIGYRPKDLDFNKTLQLAMAKPSQDLSCTNIKHFQGDDPFQVSMAGDYSYEPDQYNLDSVNIDTEMINLVENNIKYRTTTEMLLRKMTILRHAISEGAK